MVDFGFKLWRDGGAVQVDGDYRNYRVFQTGTVPANNDSIAAERTITFSARSTPPLLAVRPGVNWVTHARLLPTQDAYSFFVYANSPALDYALLDLVAQPYDNENWGLEVYDAGGGKVFDSRHRYLQFRDMVVASDPSEYDPDGDGDTLTVGGGDWATYSHASVSDAYYLLSAFGGYGREQVGPSSAADYYPCLRQRSSTEVDFGYMEVPLDIGTTTKDNFQSSNRLVVCTVSP